MVSSYSNHFSGFVLKMSGKRPCFSVENYIENQIDGQGKIALISVVFG
jgi:hypothetical protein